MKINAIILGIFVSLIPIISVSQTTFPVNGIPDKRSSVFVFTNATLHSDYQTVVENAMLIIKNGKVEYAGAAIEIPKNAIVRNLSGQHIYPSFIDPYTEYGMPEAGSKGDKNKGPQITSKTRGAYSWNEALKPEFEAHTVFDINAEKANEFRKAGFGAVLSLRRDGIARGTATMVMLGEGPVHEQVVTERAAACYSFDKGSSQQDYPTSEMGAIALLRQSFLDADWYEAGGNKAETNFSLEAWNKNKSLPQLFETNDKLQALRASRTGSEFKVNYIIKGSGDEYQRATDLKVTGNKFILPLKFPASVNVSDPYDAINVSLEELKHWEMAPANPYILYKEGIEFAFTSYGLKEVSEFLPQLRKAVLYGLPKEIALKACTYTPASYFGVATTTAALKKGYAANFIITNGDIFKSSVIITENWVAGKPYIIKNTQVADIRGIYKINAGKLAGSILTITGGQPYELKGTLKEDTNSTKVSVSYSENILQLRFELRTAANKGVWSLSGYATANGFKGTGLNNESATIAWDATQTGADTTTIPVDTTKIETPEWGQLTYPNKAYGFKQFPVAETVLFKNVTIWTNEKEGIITNGDVLISEGKIQQVGKNLAATNAKIVDGTGKHLTAGIIDEHSHIAVSNNVNECSHAVTSEVRIGDLLDCDDINIYRQLSGGVTMAQLLHGSCNPIGGQSAIIKLRWGQSPENLKMKGAPGFIKFALGENVKQSNWGDDFRIRYPQTRMGVEQIYIDAFTRAKEYEASLKSYQPKAGTIPPRRDLRLETLVEIMNKKRNITCHSYQQGEITMLMRVADSLGFKINTFTHILEGYKVADKMKAHGVGASSFSDWWGYKYEVIEAIPYNGAILHQSGVTVAYNSDDAEMARRLNQEAAKAVKYGNVNEEEALKFVTLNPAKLLHIDDKVGSIKVGKDADVVLWNDHPLSVYAKVLATYIDGICYYSVERDEELQKVIAAERARIIKKMTDEVAKGGGEVKQPSFRINKLHHCMDDEAH